MGLWGWSFFAHLLCSWSVRVFFFLMFSPGVCIWTTPARVGATIDRQLFWLHFFVVVLTVANSLTVANFTFFKLFVYLSNCYHLCYFFFVSLLLAEVYFQILWSPCKWFLLNTLTRVHVNYNLHFAAPFICSCVGLTLYVPIIAILDIWKTTLFYEGESVVYDGFKYVWPVKG